MDTECLIITGWIYQYLLREKKRTGKNGTVNGTYQSIMSITDIMHGQSTLPMMPIDPYVTYAEKTYLFSVIPALTYNFKF